MNAIQFIQQHGVDKARDVVEDAPEWAIFWISRNQYHGSVITFPNMTDHYSVDLVELKRLVESVDHINALDGIDIAKKLLARINKHGSQYAELFKRPTLEQAIADYESIYSNDMGDDTHIENHVSPSCKVGVK